MENNNISRYPISTILGATAALLTIGTTTFGLVGYFLHPPLGKDSIVGILWLTSSLFASLLLACGCLFLLALLLYQRRRKHWSQSDGRRIGYRQTWRLSSEQLHTTVRHHSLDFDKLLGRLRPRRFEYTTIDNQSFRSNLIGNLLKEIKTTADTITGSDVSASLLLFPEPFIQQSFERRGRSGSFWSQELRPYCRTASRRIDQKLRYSEVTYKVYQGDRGSAAKLESTVREDRPEPSARVSSGLNFALQSPQRAWIGNGLRQIDYYSDSPDFQDGTLDSMAAFVLFDDRRDAIPSEYAPIGILVFESYFNCTFDAHLFPDFAASSAYKLYTFLQGASSEMADMTELEHLPSATQP